MDLLLFHFLSLSNDSLRMSHIYCQVPILWISWMFGNAGRSWPCGDQEFNRVGRFGLLKATALNMSNMVGIGPFITIPLLMRRWAGRKHARLSGRAAHRHSDGMVWSELAGWILRVEERR